MLRPFLFFLILIGIFYTLPASAALEVEDKRLETFISQLKAIPEVNWKMLWIWEDDGNPFKPFKRERFRDGMTDGELQIFFKLLKQGKCRQAAEFEKRGFLRLHPYLKPAFYDPKYQKVISYKSKGDFEYLSDVAFREFIWLFSVDQHYCFLKMLIEDKRYDVAGLKAFVPSAYDFKAFKRKAELRQTTNSGLSLQESRDGWMHNLVMLAFCYGNRLAAEDVLFNYGRIDKNWVSLTAKERAFLRDKLVKTPIRSYVFLKDGIEVFQGLHCLVSRVH